EQRAGKTRSPAEHGLEFGRGAQVRAAGEAEEMAHRTGVRPVRDAGSDAEARTALGAATGQDLAAVLGRHAGTETVVALALEVRRLVGTLGGHGGARQLEGGKTAKFSNAPTARSRKSHLAAAAGAD